MSEFLDMGGYGAYVWSAFGLTALVLVANIMTARAKLNAAGKSVRGALRRERTKGS